MRAGLLRMAALLWPLLFAACDDLPTHPTAADQPKSGPMLSGSCYRTDDGRILCPPQSPDWGDGDDCDPYHYDCGGDDCISSTGGGDVTVQGCPPGGGGGGGTIGDGGDGGDGGGGGGGGGGSSDPRCPDFDPECSSEPPPADTCDSGDPVIESETVQAAFSQLWMASGIDKPQAERREHAAWIIQNPDGTFHTAAFAYKAQTPCSVNGNMAAPPGAVGWVHTHPFRAGERMDICGALKREVAPGQWIDIIGRDGQPVYQRYSNQPSQPDRDFMTSVNGVRKQLGQPQLSGYVIDNERITRYNPTNAYKDQPLPRCGY